MRLRRRKLPPGLEVRSIPAIVQPAPRSPEASFLGLSDRLRLAFCIRQNRQQMDRWVMEGNDAFGWRDRLRARIAGWLLTEGLRRRYRADLLRRRLPEGAEDQAFDRIF
jgi:hypothetical protein